MSYGFRILDSSGNVKVDDTIPTYYKGASSSISLQSGGVTFLNPDSRAFEFPVGSSIYQGYFPTTNTQTTQVYLYARGSGGSVPSSINSFLIRDFSQAPAPTGYGIAVYNSQGDVTFSSGQQTAIVSAAGRMTFANTSSVINQTIPAATTHIVPDNAWGGWLQVSSTPFIVLIGGYVFERTSTTNIRGSFAAIGGTDIVTPVERSEFGGESRYLTLVA